MKKIVILSALAALTMSGFAQETYESATVTDEDLNGTARYIGMGGAMEALGADISTISSNPAGIGMFRKSQISATGGLNISGKKLESMSGNKTTVSFDQVGGVFSMKHGRNSWLNFGVNYHISKNFNNLYTATDELSNAGQNKLSFNKFRYDGNICYNQLDQLYYNDLHGEDDYGDYYGYFNSLGYILERKNSGYIGAYDFNISGNINNTIYLGVTVGIKDVHYKSSTAYAEALENGDVYTLLDDRTVTGSGVDVKAGVIVRPFYSSPFRIGAYVHSPVFYTLTTSNNTDIYRTTDDELDYQDGMSMSYKFRVNTPWRFGLSLGHTVGNNLALGVTYDIADYSRLDNRVIYGEYDNYYADVKKSSYSDEEMNYQTRSCLSLVHTLKVGAELKVIPQLSLRIGYNYVSPKYKVSGFRDGTLDSYGTDCASTTDYTNWRDTHRFTAGIGCNISRNFTLDIAYMYQTTKGEFYPFMSYTASGSTLDPYEYNCIADKKDVTDNRHKLLATLTYKF